MRLGSLLVTALAIFGKNNEQTDEYKTQVTTTDLQGVWNQEDMINPKHKYYLHGLDEIEENKMKGEMEENKMKGEMEENKMKGEMEETMRNELEKMKDDSEEEMKDDSEEIKAENNKETQMSPGSKVILTSAALLLSALCIKVTKTFIIKATDYINLNSEEKTLSKKIEKLNETNQPQDEISLLRKKRGFLRMRLERYDEAIEDLDYCLKVETEAHQNFLKQVSDGLISRRRRRTPRTPDSEEIKKHNSLCDLPIIIIDCMNKNADYKRKNLTDEEIQKITTLVENASSFFDDSIMSRHIPAVTKEIYEKLKEDKKAKPNLTLGISANSNNIPQARS